MVKRIAIIIESSRVRVPGCEDLPGARKDMFSWIEFLKSDLGGSWDADEEIKHFHMPELAEITALLKEHRNDYVFLAFSGHGYEAVDAARGIREKRLCLNNSELHVPVSRLYPHAFGTGVFDCCRGEVDISHGSRVINFALDNLALLKEAQSPSVTQRILRKCLFLKMLNSSQRSVVKMFACGLNQEAHEKSSCGGLYTSLLIRGAQRWGGISDGTHLFTTKNAHDFALQTLPTMVSAQVPEYDPPSLSLPFAVK